MGLAMTIIVSDANIFIDLDVVDLTHAMFRLEHEFVVPDILYQEELRMHHSELPGLGLKIEKLSGQVIEETVRLQEEYSAPGVNDLMALALAKTSARTLLTGDWKLREAAEAEHVDVRGTLWLMEEMFYAGFIDIQTMAGAYEQMRENARRLPWDEVARQLKRLRKTGRG